MIASCNDRTLVTPTYYQLDAPEAKCLYAKYFEELVKQCNFKCKLTSFKLSNLRPHMEGRMYVINVTPLAHDGKLVTQTHYRLNVAYD